MAITFESRKASLKLRRNMKGMVGGKVERKTRSITPAAPRQSSSVSLAHKHVARAID